MIFPQYGKHMKTLYASTVAHMTKHLLIPRCFLVTPRTWEVDQALGQSGTPSDDATNVCEIPRTP